MSLVIAQKMTLQEDLVEYAERSQRLIEESPQMDEENTKRKLVEPLLDVLGWEILSAEVELEYSVQMGSGTKKVDYALKLEDTPVVFVEAKGCDTDISDAHINQLKSYMRQVGVDWGLISNGHSGEIFRRDHSSSRPNEISLAEFTLEDVDEMAEILQALTRDSIATGESQQIAEKVESVRRAAMQLRRQKEDIAQQVTAVVTDEIGEAVSQEVEREAKAFIDALVDNLSERPQQIQAQKPDLEDKYGIELRRGGTLVRQVSGETQAESMAKLVDYLLSEMDLSTEVETPYIPGTGRGSHALLNDMPKHPNGEEMRQHEPLSNGLYLFTSLNAQSKKRYISELCAKVDVDCEFVGEW